ncbi:MAG: hypothetical protein AB7U82_15110 [Blastocatellales bacterium]
MDQLKNFGDQRQTAFCLNCGQGTGTRDHVPSKVFLDDPYPENLPVVGACQPCNQRFSLDEEYVACLVECARVGDVTPSSIKREKIRRILTKKPTLASKLKQARVVKDGSVSFSIDPERIQNVFLKLARGHALFEQNMPMHHEPANLSFGPLNLLTDQSRREFESSRQGDIWPEVGSRAMQRLVAAGSSALSEWIVVQPRRYRYLTMCHDSLTVRIVLSEYIWCEAVW